MDLLHRSALAAETVMDRAVRRARLKLRSSDWMTIQPYRGWANDRVVRLAGRLLLDGAPGLPDDDASWWHNLRDTVRRWASDEVPGVRVRAEIDGSSAETTSGEEGFFSFEIPLARPLPDGEPWREVQLTLPDIEEDGEHPTATALVLAPPSSAGFGIISDIDDTVIRSSMTDAVRAAKLTFLRNARSRKPLPGVDELYRQLHAGRSGHDGNPIFYVSSSAWNLYDLFEGIVAVHRLPAGPILLRDVGLTERHWLKGGHEHKLHAVVEILDTYPELPFVLLGDSGQRDPELYCRVVEQRPHRIKAIWIRDVTPRQATGRDAEVRDIVRRVERAGVAMYPVDESSGVAEQAHRLGLLHAEALDAVREDQDRDRREGKVAPDRVTVSPEFRRAATLGVAGVVVTGAALWWWRRRR